MSNKGTIQKVEVEVFPFIGNHETMECEIEEDEYEGELSSRGNTQARRRKCWNFSSNIVSNHRQSSCPSITVVIWTLCSDIELVKGGTEMLSKQPEEI